MSRHWEKSRSKEPITCKRHALGAPKSVVIPCSGNFAAAQGLLGRSASPSSSRECACRDESSCRCATSIAETANRRRGIPCPIPLNVVSAPPLMIPYIQISTHDHCCDVRLEASPGVRSAKFDRLRMNGWVQLTTTDPASCETSPARSCGSKQRRQW